MNNAAIMPGIFADPVATDDDLDALTFRTNAEGVYFVTKYALPFLLRDAAAVKEDPFERTVVFMGSAAGWLAEPEDGNGMLAYHATKAAVNGLVVHLHQSFDAPAPEGSMAHVVRSGRILGRVASADPGFVATELGRETLPPGVDDGEAYAASKPGFGAVSIEEGADTPLWLVLADTVESGKAYFKRQVHSF